MTAMFVYLNNCAPFFGHHAVRYDDHTGEVTFGYAFTNSHRETVFSTEAVQVAPDGSVRMRRKAPAYITCSPPKHHWEPVDPVPATVLGEMPGPVTHLYFEEADRLLKENR